ncbi:tail fiber protein [Sphingomonas sp. HF-S3]|uniref:Tail fiber protein n=1 Tax=Sphingomonas rustica TaxID=3103142 RepID=A0ABV0BHV6_9SPHN
MSTPYLGQLKLFAGTFAPVGWALCNGQLVSIAQNDALYALLGTTFGGDGINTFGLPDFRGRAAVGAQNGATGPGLTARQLGSVGGSANVTLTTANLPAHQHSINAWDTPATTSNPSGKVLARPGLANPNSPEVGNSLFYLSNQVTANIPALPANTLSNSGNSQPHNNLMPYLAVTHIIALYGIFPSQN